MTWTYDPATLSTSAVAQIRFVIGDTDPGDPQLQDEEITFVSGLAAADLSSPYALYEGAAQCCEALAARFSRLADSMLGDARDFASQIGKAYALRTDENRRKAALYALSAYAGAVSAADHENTENNTDRRIPAFTRRQQFPIDSLTASYPPGTEGLP